MLIVFPNCNIAKKYDSDMLIIGPRYNRKDSTHTGGIVVLFEDWIEYCNKKGFGYSVVDTNKANYLNNVIAYFSIILQIVRKSSKDNVIFLNGTLKDYLFIAPIVILIGKLFRKKIFVRKFAGSFGEYYNKANRVYKMLLRYVVSNACLAFWETKSLTSFGMTLNPASYWFPNVRHKSNFKRDLKNKYSRRFIFLSQVKKEKGIDYLLKAFSLLDTTYHIDIFGPLVDIATNEIQGSNIVYKGRVSPDNVCKTLSEYDVLILPTFWKNEGYPGIIIEAFSVGLPVIATNIGGIPEILKDKYNGILIPPMDSDALCDAIRYFDESNYVEMARNSLKSFNEFDSDIVNDCILKILSNE